MPELDTYKTLERYARNNNDSAAIQAYEFLKRRTALHVKWQAALTALYMDPEFSIKLYTGIKEQVGKPRKLNEMTEEERRSLFEKQCSEMGIELDPSLFKKDSM